MTIRRPHLAESIGLVLIVSLAAALRLPYLDAYTGKFDEGIRTAQLMLMSHGFRPVRDIFASQGPLSLDVFYPFWAVSGGTLGGARLAVVVYSLAAIVGSALVARSLGGALAGMVTALILAVSPTFVKNSRLALVEIPAMVPALVALLAVIHGRQRSDARGFLVGGSLMALAMSIKPMAAPVLAPLAVLSLGRRASPKAVATHALLAAIAGLVVLGLIIALFGLEQLLTQVVRYRQGSMAVERWSLGENWRLISDELVQEQPGLYVLAILGAGALLIRQPIVGIALLLWLGASLWLLITYVPLQIKHDVIMLPPLAIIAGAGLGILVAEARQATRRVGRVAIAVLGIAAALAYLVFLPAVSTRNSQTISVAGEGRAELYPDETELIRTVTSPSDFIISDDPFLAYASSRLVPPLLVDTSYYRIRSGSLGVQEVIDSATNYDVKLLFLFTDGLREMRRLAEWVDERYQVVTSQERSNGKDRSIYLRQDADFPAARAFLERQLDESINVEFGNHMRLVGYGLDRGEVRLGGRLELTVEWESTAPVPVDYRLVTVLRGPDGQPTDQSERSLSGGGVGTSRWEVGHWIFRGTQVELRRARQPGDYTLLVGLYDSRARRLAPVTRGQAGPDGETAVLGVIRVR